MGGGGWGGVLTRFNITRGYNTNKLNRSRKVSALWSSLDAKQRAKICLLIILSSATACCAQEWIYTHSGYSELFQSSERSSTGDKEIQDMSLKRSKGKMILTQSDILAYISSQRDETNQVPRVFTSNSRVCVRSNTFRVMSFCFPCRKKVISCYIENSPERIRSSTSGKAISKKASYSSNSGGYSRKIHTGGSVRRSIPSFYMPLSTARVPLLYTRILVLMMAIFVIFQDII